MKEHGNRVIQDNLWVEICIQMDVCGKYSCLLFPFSFLVLKYSLIMLIFTHIKVITVMRSRMSKYVANVQIQCRY
jgi:hypothetical protein